MRKRIALVTAMLGAALLIPGVVYASHQFSDVPDDHTFHNDIEWLADNGITKGCGGTNFCPEDSVSRGQMAAFMRRFHSAFIADSSSAIAIDSVWRGNNDPPSSGNGVIDGLTMNLDIPEYGLLIVEGTVDLSNQAESDVLNCGINSGGDVSLAFVDSWRTIDLSLDRYDTCSTATGIFVSPGEQTVRIVLSSAKATTEAYGGNFTAVLYTSDGVTTLSSDDTRNLSTAPEPSDMPKQNS